MLAVSAAQLRVDYIMLETVSNTKVLTINVLCKYSKASESSKNLVESILHYEQFPAKCTFCIRLTVQALFCCCSDLSGLGSWSPRSK